MLTPKHDSTSRDIHLAHARVTTLVCLLVAALWLVLAGARTAQADGTVMDCSNQNDFAAKMNSNSGYISFNCGGVFAPATITITQPGGFTAIPGAFFTIDGGNLVTLSGGNTNRIFDVGSGMSLTLTNITLTDGAAAAGGNLPDQGGAILNEGDLLVLDNVTIRNGYSTFAGGALRSIAGTTTVVKDSLIESNQSGYGGGIDSSGTLTLINTTVRSNHAMTEGGGLDMGGLTVISNSQIVSNTANLGGGGINITAPGRVFISGSQLDANKMPATNTLGGGILNVGMLTVIQSTLNGNFAYSGGGIFNYRTVTLTNVTLSGNSATNGGGIYNFHATVTLNNSTLSGNTALTYGGGIYHSGGNAAQSISLKSTIVANSPSGENCTRDPGSASGSTIVSFGYNLSSDSSCIPYFNYPTVLNDLNNTDPNLGPLAHNGGPTLTHMPLTPDSPGIDRIPNFTNGCGTTLTTDQRSAARPINGKCDIGSVEYGALFPQLYLPLIMR